MDLTYFDLKKRKEEIELQIIDYQNQLESSKRKACSESVREFLEAEVEKLTFARSTLEGLMHDYLERGSLKLLS